MKSTGFRIFAVLALLGASAGWFWQQQQLRRSREENAQWRAGATELDSLREEVTRLRQTQIDPAELQRLRQVQSEMLRLRGETSQLRRQLKEEQQAKRDAPAKETPPASPPTEAPVSPVQTYSANLRATLPAGHCLIAGGWATTNGKRTLLMVEPIIGESDQAGQVAIQARFVEMPEEALTKVGLDSLRTDGKDTSGQLVFDPERFAQLLASLTNTAEVNILSAPQVFAPDGRQSKIQMVTVRTVAPGDTRELGPVLDLVPRLSPDGRSVDLSVSARLQLLSPTAR